MVELVVVLQMLVDTHDESLYFVSMVTRWCVEWCSTGGGGGGCSVMSS